MSSKLILIMSLEFEIYASIKSRRSSCME